MVGFNFTKITQISDMEYGLLNNGSVWLSDDLNQYLNKKEYKLDCDMGRLSSNGATTVNWILAKKIINHPHIRIFMKGSLHGKV
jgi:hypothetical protein